MWVAGARHGWALPTLAYKLDRHTQSDYLDCHIYLESGAIHHSSVADSTRPMLIPSGGESSLSQSSQVMCTHSSTPTCLKLPRKGSAGCAFGEPTEVSREEKDLHGAKGRAQPQTACVPARLQLRPPMAAHPPSPPCHTWEMVQ